MMALHIIRLRRLCCNSGPPHRGYFLWGGRVIPKMIKVLQEFDEGGA